MSEEAEAEERQARDEDARKTGDLLDGLGCAGQGCLLGTLQASCLLLIIWGWAEL